MENCGKHVRVPGDCPRQLPPRPSGHSRFAPLLALSACSACAGDYQDPERTSPPAAPALRGASSGRSEAEADDEEQRATDDEFPADEA